MIPLVAVYGTFGGDWGESTDPCVDESHWWHYAEADGRDSAWWQYMRTLGFAPLRADTGFAWSGDLNGLEALDVLNPLTWFRPRRRLTDWQAGGRALVYYVAPQVETTPTWVAVAHSHGGQVALYAAAMGLRIPLLVTIATPHRADLKKVTERALKNIGYWIHVCDNETDHTGLAGQFGDGAVATDRRQPLANVNVQLRAIDHSRLLRDAGEFHLWGDSILPRDIAALTAPKGTP